MTEQDLQQEQDLQDDLVPPDEERVSACHEMLLRLAGRAPDGLMTRSRDWLARGEFASLARAVAHWAVSEDAVLAEADADLLADLLDEAGADDSGLSQVTVDDDDPYPHYDFGPQIPPELAGTRRTQADVPADEAAVQAVTAEPGVIGLWRAWRFPSDGAPWPPPKRVFVVEAGGGDEPGLAARVAGRLAAAGEADPQVEVCSSGAELPAYSELARAYGELLWAAEPARQIQVAGIFDEVDPDLGPSFLPDHLVLDEDEAVMVAEYLYGAEPLLMTESLMDDLADDEQVECVPMSFRTDGHWVWNEASAYYADEHLLAPDPGLLEHLRASDYEPPAVTGVDLYRAQQVLEGPAGDGVLRMFGAELDENAASAASRTGTGTPWPAFEEMLREATDDEAAGGVARCHAMLLRLAGQLPDDLITQCRSQLAEEALGTIARAVLSHVLAQNLTLASVDVKVLAALLADTGEDAPALSGVEIDDFKPVTWRFTDQAAAAGGPPQGEADGASTAAEELDQVVAAALAEEAGAIGCWRACRVPRGDAPAAPAKLVFVVEVRADADMTGAAARMQQRLAAAGEASPQVEVYCWTSPLPPYQQLAKASGQLIWAEAADPGMQLASPFDEGDAEDGPSFSPDHPRLEENEAGKVARYLREAEAVLFTSARMDDVVDASRQWCVPLNFRTDGTWIWNEASAYYAQEHLMEPDPGLLAHIRSSNYTVPDENGVVVHRALAVLRESLQ